MESWLSVASQSVAAAEQAVLGECFHCSASCSCGTDSSGMCMAQPFNLLWADLMDKNKAIAAINICMPESNLVVFLECN